MRSMSTRPALLRGRTILTGSALAMAVALAMALPGTASAQSLQAVYEAARAYDAAYLSARALADSAQYKAEQAEALNRPTVSAVATGSLAQTNPYAAGYLGSQTGTGVLNGKYPLFNRGNTANIEQARKALISAQADLDVAEQDLLVRVAQAYFDVLASQDALGTQRANKVAITEQLASAKRNFEVGTATITDTREAQAKDDLATAQVIAAENDLLTKRTVLDQLVGRQNVTPKPLLVPVVLPSTQPANAEEWVTNADSVHPSVRKARLGLDVAQLEIDKAKAAKLPTVDAVASATASNTRGALPEYSHTAGPTRIGSVGVQLNWTIFAGGSLENRVKETVSLEEKARNDLEAARRGVAQGTRVAYFGVQSGLAQVKALEAAESSTSWPWKPPSWATRWACASTWTC